MIDISESKVDLKSVIFPVEERPIFLSSEDVGNDLFENGGSTFEEVNKFRAIVDTKRNYVFSVVSRQYRLVTNEEAIQFGRQCFEHIFGKGTESEMRLFNVVMPSTRSSCHVDYLHEGRPIEPRTGDKWWPYLRITNSYNRTKPLRFDLGFCRGMCTNGLIFGRRGIQLRYDHTKDHVARTMGDFETAFEDFGELERDLRTYITALLGCEILRKQMPALLCRALGITMDQSNIKTARQRDRVQELRKHVDGLTEEYFEELGSNAYAAFNVLTDYASRPVHGVSPAVMINSFQRRCGAWAESFSKRCVEPGFDIEAYLEEEFDPAEALRR